MKPASKRFTSPPELKCELCRCYTENAIEDYGSTDEIGDNTEKRGGKKGAKMRGRFCNEHRELIRRIDDAAAVIQIVDVELSARIEFSRAEKINRFAVL